MEVPQGAQYNRRNVDGWLDEYMPRLPAFLLVGPRAAGKTTTATRRGGSIVRLDRPADAGAFAADPDAALRGFLAEPVVLDEWQVVPEILGAVKRSVDADPSPGRFLITGSVRAALTERMWPGTGRLMRAVVYPMTVRERLSFQRPEDDRTFVEKLTDGAPLGVPFPAPDLRDYVELAVIGGFPYPALHLDQGGRELWMQSYIGDLIDRDIAGLESQVTKGRDGSRLRRYLGAYALSSAGTAAEKTIYDAAGINRHTAVAYEGLLESVFAIDRVPSWRTNRLGRLVGQPKRYVIDSALLAAVLGVDGDGVLRDSDLLGRVLDTFVVAQIRPELAISSGRPRLYHLRTKGGEREVDLVLELSDGRVIGVEIKATAAPTAQDARHLRWLRDQLGDRFVKGVLFHTGPRVFELEDSILAVPIAALWG